MTKTLYEQIDEYCSNGEYVLTVNDDRVYCIVCPKKGVLGYWIAGVGSLLDPLKSGVLRMVSGFPPHTFGTKSERIIDHNKDINKLTHNTMDNLKAGSVIKGSGNGYTLVLNVLGTGDHQLVFLSMTVSELNKLDSSTIDHTITLTLGKLKAAGWRHIGELDDLLKEQEAKEVTMEEVCKKFGYDVKIKKQ